jgi:hypothetical protein
MSNTRLTIAVVYLLGLSTCFLPVVSVSPPALGKTEWALWDFWLLGSGPNGAEWWWWNIGRLSVSHAVLAGGLLLLWLPRYLWATLMCALISLRLAGPLAQRHYTISHVLAKQAGWHHGTITTNPDAYVLPALLVFLLFVLWTEWKDSAAA